MMGSCATFSSWRRAVASISRAQTFTGTRPALSSWAIGMASVRGIAVGKESHGRLLRTQLVHLALGAFRALEELVGAGERRRAEHRRLQVAERGALAHELLRLGLADVLQRGARQHQRG